MPRLVPAGTTLTPLEKQVMEIKSQNSGVLLLVECGYKFRFFAEDAEIAAKVLNIICHLDHNFMTASIPSYRLFTHVRRLVAAGHKVGVVKQVETAALKAAGDNKSALFSRELTDLYTKSTLIGEDVCPSDADFDISIKANGFLMCIYERCRHRTGRKKLAIVAVQASTGKMLWDYFEDTDSRCELQRRLIHIDPIELLLPQMLSRETESLLRDTDSRKCDEDVVRIERISEEGYTKTTAVDHVRNFLANLDNSNVYRDLPLQVISCLSAVLQYLKEFKLERILTVSGNLSKFSDDVNFVNLPGQTVRNLELLKNGTSGRMTGSLFWVLDKTRTKFGQRMLRQWISRPLRKAECIRDRLDAVQECMNTNQNVLGEVAKLLKVLPDIERGLCNILHKKCSPAEFLSTTKALSTIHGMLTKNSELIQTEVKSKLLKTALTQTASNLDGVDAFLSVLDESAARKCDKTNLFTNLSNFPQVEQSKKEIENVLSEIDGHKREACSVLGMPGLEYRTVSGNEFLIELRNSNLKRVPTDWLKISATKTVTRFRPPNVVKSYTKLCQLREHLVAVCKQAWLKYLGEYSVNHRKYQEALNNLATVDCIFSLAEAAKQCGYCKPDIIDEVSCIDIANGRHPVIELLDGRNQYVANDTSLSGDGERCMVITGPNMGGKSSYIRQVALICIMSQIGSYVPAESARLGVLDAVYTRMGTMDEIHKNRSTLLVELEEASEILRKASSKSLVILDELGRGTSTHDGMAIAFATLDYFISKVSCLTLFITHYPMLAEIEELHIGHARNYHMSYVLNQSGSAESGDEIVRFLYKLKVGVASRSYGQSVAKLANLPAKLLSVAACKSREMEQLMAEQRQQIDIVKCLFSKPPAAVLHHIANAVNKQ